jgi:hypothetical protein
MVPPENQGRRSFASASRRAIRLPTPVGWPKTLYQLTTVKSGAEPGQVRGVGRYEGGGIEQYVVAVLLGLGDPLQRVLDTGEVGLRRVRQQSARARVGIMPLSMRASVVHTRKQQCAHA